MGNSTILRRYTDITSVIDILRNKKLTLVDPQSWEDKNDSYFMSVYKERKSLRTLSALCFTTAAETYHHWKIFSGIISGVCIVFHADKLHERIIGKEGLKSRMVVYKILSELETNRPNLKLLTFVKRYPFRDEKEFSIIYESALISEPYFELDIQISDISRIFLSPWIHPSLVEGVKSILKSFNGCENLKIFRSKLIGNENWKKYAQEES